jgi:alpha-methylacyl-CoA racemase
MDEAAAHPHAVARSAYARIPGADVPQPAVAPRFSRSTPPVPPAPPRPGEHTRSILAELGLGDRAEALLESGAVGD